MRISSVSLLPLVLRSAGKMTKLRTGVHMKNEFVFTHQVDVCGQMSGIVTVPTGFDPEKESLPVIVFLHGAGERGPELERVKVHGIPKIFSKNPDYHGLRVITLSPQCPADMVWSSLVYPLRQWVDAAAAKLNGDKDRISLTGLSMGGFGTWSVITAMPEYFSCAAPICGGGLSWLGDKLKGTKLRVFHGLDDGVVPFVYSQLMVDAARQNGADVTLYAYDHVGHGSWVKAYEETDLIEWLAAQKR